MIVVWSNDATYDFGTTTALGGSLAGAGGLVEVSSHGFLDFQGAVDVSAAHGTAGELLLDPDSINLTNLGSNVPGQNDSGFAPPMDVKEAFTDDNGEATVLNVAANGSFAHVSSGSTIILQANTITVTSAFDVPTATGTTNVSLELDAHRIHYGFRSHYDRRRADADDRFWHRVFDRHWCLRSRQAPV